MNEITFLCDVPSECVVTKIAPLHVKLLIKLRVVTCPINVDAAILKL